MGRLIALLLAFGAVLFAAGDDPYCPAYPPSERAALQARLQLEKSASALAAHRNGKNSPLKYAIQADAVGGNIIDQYIFGKMAGDGVAPAPPAGDTEILRRLYLDLTGHIPSPDEAQAFLADPSPDKRAVLIQSLINSDAFVDYWTFFYANQFEVTSRYYNFIGIPGRNLFYDALRRFVASGRSYRDFAFDLITATGDSFSNGLVNFVVRGVQQGDPIQDTYDSLTNRVTTQFLGVQSQCISCHNGAHHLEPINLYLSVRKRDEFWRQSAFFSRTSINQISVDPNSNQLRFAVFDRANGGYTSNVDPNNPGPRPTRIGGPYSAQFLLTGETPGSGDWRAELARIVTSDKQFARASVNYIWAHFFKYGIVDPPDGWDLARVDPSNPPPAPWPLQVTHPELLNALADEFIQSNYSIRHIIELIANSQAYQLSSRYEGDWRPEYELYFAKHFPRRLYAEEIYDAVVKATGTEVPMQVEGFLNPVYYATQLPDVTEPRNAGNIVTFLSSFGRGDWFQVPRRQSTDVLQALFQMNDNQFNFRTFGNRNVTTNVTRIMDAGLADRDAVDTLFLATLARKATDEEFAILIKKKTANYEQWLADVQWALLNKIDFLFSQ